MRIWDCFIYPMTFRRSDIFATDSDHVLGKIVEIGLTEDIINNAVHPYVHALLSAVPVPDPSRHKKKVEILARSQCRSICPADADLSLAARGIWRSVRR